MQSVLAPHLRFRSYDHLFATNTAIRFLCLVTYLGNATSISWVPDQINQFIGYSPGVTTISCNTVLL
jgi:hypothetical protein